METKDESISVAPLNNTCMEALNMIFSDQLYYCICWADETNLLTAACVPLFPHLSFFPNFHLGKTSHLAECKESVCKNGFLRDFCGDPT